MHPLEKKISRILAEKKLIVPGERLIVGVSGGPDSLCLLHVLNSLAADYPFTMAVAYFDHRLRPDESGREIALVRDAARKMGCSFYHGAGDVAESAGQKGLSVEDAARTLRYEFLQEVLSDFGGRKIAVAHTADDQAEELLIRLIRGTGRKGLAGMEFMRGSLIIRPFLETPKDEILAYLKDKMEPYCTDSSNRQRIYLRNRIRLDLIPYIEEKFNPGIKKILRQTSSLLQEEESLLDALTEDAYKHTVLEEDGSALDLVCLTGQHKAIQRRIIEKMLLKLDNNPSFRQIEQILYLAGHGENGAGVHLSRGLRGEIKGKKLLFSYPLGRTSWRGDLKSSVEDSVFDMDVMEPGLFCLDEARQVEVSCLDYLPEQSELASEGVDFFDLDLLSFPFKIRNRRPGDRFHPLGSPGHKKVGDFLTDLKVAESIRRHIPVLEYGGKVAALLGIRISHRFRVRSSTRKVMRVRVLGACRT